MSYCFFTLISCSKYISLYVSAFGKSSISNPVPLSQQSGTNEPPHLLSKDPLFSTFWLIIISLMANTIVPYCIYWLSWCWGVICLTPDCSYSTPANNFHTVNHNRLDHYSILPDQYGSENWGWTRHRILVLLVILKTGYRTSGLAEYCLNLV